MDAFAFVEKHGKEVATSVAIAAGTNWEYFRQIVHGHRRPSVDLAEKLVASSAERFPNAEDQLDFQALLKAKAGAAA